MEEVLDEVNGKVEEIRWRDYRRRRPFIRKSIERRKRKALRRRARKYYDWWEW